MPMNMRGNVVFELFARAAKNLKAISRSYELEAIDKRQTVQSKLFLTNRAYDKFTKRYAKRSIHNTAKSQLVEIESLSNGEALF